LIPGSDLLSEAFALIGTQTINYRYFVSRDKNSQFQQVSAFGDWFNFEASIQRVPRSQYIQYNLEFQKNYVTVFASLNMVDIERDTAGDQFIYAGRLYQLESQGTWFPQDGWGVCMAVDIGAAPAITN
jgi:hypothetical protein